MPNPLDEPITKVSVNLFSSDYETMRRLFDRGWAEKVRELVREYLKERGSR